MHIICSSFCISCKLRKQFFSPVTKRFRELNEWAQNLFLKCFFFKWYAKVTANGEPSFRNILPFWSSVNVSKHIYKIRHLKICAIFVNDRFNINFGTTTRDEILEHGFVHSRSNANWFLCFSAVLIILHNKCLRNIEINYPTCINACHDTFRMQNKARLFWNNSGVDKCRIVQPVYIYSMASKQSAFSIHFFS